MVQHAVSALVTSRAICTSYFTSDISKSSSRSWQNVESDQVERTPYSQFCECRKKRISIDLTLCRKFGMFCVPDCSHFKWGRFLFFSKNQFYCMVSSYVSIIKIIITYCIVTIQNSLCRLCSPDAHLSIKKRNLSWKSFLIQAQFVSTIYMIRK